MGKIEYLLDGVVLSPFSLLSQLTQDTRALVDALTGGGYYLVAFFKSVVLELMKCFYQTDQRRASEGNGLLI